MQYVGEETQIEFSALLVEKTEITVQKVQGNNYLGRKVPEVQELPQIPMAGVGVRGRGRRREGPLNTNLHVYRVKTHKVEQKQLIGKKN